MKKIESGASSAQLVTLTAMGCSVRIVVFGRRADEAVAAIGEAWAWCIDRDVGDAVAGDTIQVVLDDDPIVFDDARSAGSIVTSSLGLLLHQLSQAVTLACINRRAGSLLMMHACGLTDPETGRTVAAIAPSGTGKTTFARTLGNGRVYVSDETVAVDDDDVIVPYLKPLSVYGLGADLIKDQSNAGTFNMLRPTVVCRLTDLWFLDRHHEAIAPTIEPMGTLDAVMAMVPQLSHLAAMGKPLHRIERLLTDLGGLKRVTYHEVEDLELFLQHSLGAVR